MAGCLRPLWKRLSSEEIIRIASVANNGRFQFALAFENNFYLIDLRSDKTIPHDFLTMSQKNTRPALISIFFIVFLLHFVTVMAL